MSHAPHPNPGWHQLIYGKLVTAHGGPIRAGAEHEHIGRSTGFPPALVRWCHPAQTGLGIFPNGADWTTYPWRDNRGGIVCTVHYLDTGPWLLAGRICGRPEDPGRPSRFYVQGHYLARPLYTWRVDQVAQLATIMDACPLIERNHDLPTLADAPGTRSLPDDWLARVTPYLQVLMSGRALSVQDWHARLDDQLDLFCICLAAVPGVLRWRVPVGVGLLTMNGAMALGHGMAAQGIRVIQGTLRGITDEDMQSGVAWVDWLRERTVGANTVHALADAVDQALPELSDPLGEPAGRPWNEVAGEVIEALHERDRLHAVREWLVGRGGSSPDMRFRHQRPAALAEVVAAADGRGAALIDAVAGPEWTAAWRSPIGDLEPQRGQPPAAILGEDMYLPVPVALARWHALAWVSGHEATGASPVTLTTLSTIALSSSTAGRAADALDDALTAALDERSPPGNLADVDWVALVTGPGAPWLTTWRDGAMARLTWLAVYRSQRGDAGLLDALPAGPSVVAAARQLLSSKSDAYAIPADAFLRLAEAVSPTRLHQADRVFDAAVDRASVLEAIDLIEALATKGWLTPRYVQLTQESSGEWLRRTVPSLARACLASEHFPPLAVRLLLRGISHAPDSAALRRALRRRLGQPCAALLLDDHEPVEAPTDGLGDDLALTALIAQPSRLDTLLEEDERLGCPPDLPALIVRWVERGEVSAAQPAGRLLYKLLRREHIDEVLIQDAVCSGLRRCVERLAPQFAPVRTTGNLATSDLGRLLEIIPLAVEVEASADEIGRLSSEVIWGSDWLGSRPYLAGRAEQPGWRLVAGTNKPLGSFDLDVLARMSGPARLRAACAGVAVPNQLLLVPEKETLSGLFEDPTTRPSLVRLALERAPHPLTSQLFSLVADRLLVEGGNRALVDAIGKSPGTADLGSLRGLVYQLGRTAGADARADLIHRANRRAKRVVVVDLGDPLLRQTFARLSRDAATCEVRTHEVRLDFQQGWFPGRKRSWSLWYISDEDVNSVDGLEAAYLLLAFGDNDRATQERLVRALDRYARWRTDLDRLYLSFRALASGGGCQADMSFVLQRDHLIHLPYDVDLAAKYLRDFGCRLVCDADQ